MKPWTKWQDWSTLALGSLLFLAPLGLAAANAPQCRLGTSSWFNTPSALNAWIVGILLVAASLRALARPGALAAVWTRIVLSVWLFFAPWVLGFMSSGAAAWTSWAAGILVFALALWELLGARTVQTKVPAS